VKMAHVIFFIQKFEIGLPLSDGVVKVYLATSFGVAREGCDGFRHLPQPGRGSGGSPIAKIFAGKGRRNGDTVQSRGTRKEKTDGKPNDASAANRAFDAINGWLKANPKK
jgi:hypothetical protein